MKNIVKEIHDLLIKRGKKIAVAESCTGGLLSNFLTQLPDSSKYFILGVVVYSNQAKEDILGVPSKIIVKNGAVSKDVARRMAKSVRLKAKTDFGIAITGIAGPAGGSKAKPVGTVFIAVDSKNKNICKKFRFSGPRATIRNKSAFKVIEIINNII